jgi:integrase
LTEKAVAAAKEAGRISDGGGLFLRVSSPTSKSWSFMWTVNGKRRELGLGPYSAVSLARARELAAKCRTDVAAGSDPHPKEKNNTEPTFAECCQLFLQGKISEWSNPKHQQQWRNTLNQYCKRIADKRVSQIDLDDVLSVLQPIWNEKLETASRLRGRIERVLNFAKVRGWREGENPALWRGNLDNILPKPGKLNRGHHPSMPYAEVPAFVSRLRERDNLAARALEFVILTGCRSGEALQATWDEIDLDNRIWTIPAARMGKTKREHRVPLSDAAMAILKPLHDNRINDYVFPGQKHNRPISEMSLEMQMRRLNAKPYTVHGFRSSFRDWAGDETDFSWEIAEKSLSHKVGSDVERAYRRSDALEKRRALMDAWGHYVRSTT